MDRNPAVQTALPRRQVVLTMGGLMLALFLASLDQPVVSMIRCAVAPQERKPCGDDFADQASNGC